ncbi:uncharacterized protein ACRADG_007824 [Cochliomyia hominivorax]
MMSEKCYMVFLMCLICGVTLSCATDIKTISNEIDSNVGEKVYVQTSDLVIREKSGKPLIYHFITDYPHPHVPTNNYIKPWDVVASKPLRVKNAEGANSRILKKNNILYLAKSDESVEDQES